MKRRALLTPVTLTVLITACGGGGGEPSPALPPLGRWKVIELTGTIRSHAGGTPVLCLQQTAELRPLPLYDAAVKERSWVELGSGSTFYFAFYFEDGGTHDVVSNLEGLSSTGFFAEALEPSAVRRASRWSWTESHLEAVIESISDGSSQELARFSVSGTFATTTQMNGTWLYEKKTQRGHCWSRAAGRGSWKASTGP